MSPRNGGLKINCNLVNAFKSPILSFGSFFIAFKAKMSILHIFLRVFLLWISIDVSYTHVRKGTDTSTSIGDVYDPHTQICCQSTAHEKPHRRSYQKCCGHHIYDVTCGVCCNDKVHRHKCGYACCGSNYFDINDALCCSERQVVKFPENISKDDADYLECCGDTKLYDSRTSICSPCDGVTVITKRHHNIGCCGNETFNLDSEMCCAETVVARNDTITHCCGRTGYNPYEQICCSDNIVDVSQTPEQYGGCCGKTPYLRYTQGCCDDVVYNMTEFGCCAGGDVFNLTSQLCCDGSVVRNKTSPTDNCCAHTVYNRKESLCCMGMLYPKNDDTISCCGSELYNTSNQLCCYKEASVTSWVVNKTSASHRHCCGNVSFDFYSQTCCNEETSHVITVDPPFFPYAPCCNNATFKPEEQICCQTDDDVSILYNRSGYDECCNGVHYDTRHQMCCGGDVIARTENVTCCGGKSVDLNKQICCYDYDKQSLVGIDLKPPFYRNNSACCGTQLYRHRQEECCGDTTVFQPESELCCGNTVAPMLTNTTMHCCSDEPYDANSHVCCAGLVRAKTSPEQTSCCYVQ